MINLLKDNNSHIYTITVLAIVGQFGEKVNLGKIRSALKEVEFEDMIEVDLEAYILTLK